jgi:hypothetical protein
MLFLAARRPPEEIRDQVDIKVCIEKQSIIIYEIRPYYLDPSKILDIAIAKTTYIASRNNWNVFWKRSDLKWHTYKPEPTVKDIDEFFNLVNEDRYCCFFG